MKIVTLRTFSREAPDIDETVLVTHERRVIGQYTPVPKVLDIPTISLEASMDESVKKAIEPEQVKERRGKLSKGLGELPGENHEPKPTIERDPYKDFRPVPKK